MMLEGLKTVAVALFTRPRAAHTGRHADIPPPAAPVQPVAGDVNAATVRIDRVPPAVPLPVMADAVREANGRAHHVHDLGPAFPAPATPRPNTPPPSAVHAVTAGWGAPVARPYAIAEELAAAIHDGTIAGYPSHRTGLTWAGVTWKDALMQAGIDPDGPHEKLPDGEAA